MQNGENTKTEKVQDERDFEKLLRLTEIIPNKEQREYVRGFLQEVAPKYFRHIPASSTGKFHPAYALGNGGLIRHTIAAVYIGNEICKLEYLKLSQKDKSEILAALFLHDTFKQGEFETGQTNLMDHAKIAADKVTNKEIASLMLSHMGQWGTNKPGTTKHFIVHLADCLASRKPLEVNFELIV